MCSRAPPNGGCSARAPLGQLLVESFERRLFPAGDRPATMGASDQLALILNTTIAAHPQEDSDLLRGLFAAPEDKAISCNALHMPYVLMEGGRLIFTNLADRDAIPSLRRIAAGGCPVAHSRRAPALCGRARSRGPRGRRQRR